MPDHTAQPVSPQGIGASRGDTQASDEQVLASFGYRQELRRALRLFSLYAVAFSIISITTGISLNYGFGINNFGPASIWLWLIAGAGQLLVALIIAELGTRIPLAGYAYQWGARLVNSTYGWFVGFTGLMYMAVGGAGITLLATAPLAVSLFGWNENNPRLVLFVALVLLVLPVLINIVSVQLAARVNNLAVATEIVGMVGFGVALFLLWVAKAKPVHHGLGFLATTTRTGGGPLWYMVALAGLMGIFTIVGFELAADLSEEAVQARVTVPKAVIWSVASSVVLGMVALIGFTIAIPDLHAIQASGLPLVDIVGYWVGGFWTKVFLAIVVFSIFALTVVGAAAQARLAYSMARDNMLPFSGALRRVNPTTRTPIVALVVMLVIGAGFMLFGYVNHGGAFGALVGATSSLPFIVYLLTILAYVAKRRDMARVPGAFSLGRWAAPVMVAALAWVVLALVIVTFPHEFRKADYVVIGVEVVAAVWYLAVLRGRLQRGTAGVSRLADYTPTAQAAAPKAEPQLP
jgi:amino acid transporter